MIDNSSINDMSCPSCGHDQFDPEKECICGYQADESSLVDLFLMKPGVKSEAEFKSEPPNKVTALNKDNSDKDILIKEVDSWAFRFSSDDNSICLGTPALQSFRLKLTVSDLEELLEFMYEKTGQERTTRKLRLSAEEVNDIIIRVHEMIEEKRSRAALKFSNNELLDMANMINIKLRP